MRKQITSLSLLLALTNLSCNNDGNVTVTCIEAQKFQSNVGIININQRSLGDIIILDTQSKHSYHFGHLNTSASKIDSSTRRDSMILLTYANMNIHFTGGISQASKNIQTEVSSTVKNNTTFFLSNFIRRNINPSQQIDGITNTELIRLSEILSQNDNLIVAIVSSMVYADAFQFRLKKSTTGNIDLNIVKIGNFKLNVNYDCQNAMQIDAKQDGIFFKISYFTISKDSNLIFFPATIDFTEYNSSQNLD